MTRSGWIAIGLLGCLPLVAKAGVVWEMARDSDTTWPAGGFRFTADRGRVRVEHFAASGEPSSISIVVDGTQSTFSSRQKTVDVCDPQCMTELAEPAAIRRAQEAQLAQVPERHRESMRQGMGRGPQPAVSVRQTERVEVVGQYRKSLPDLDSAAKTATLTPEQQRAQQKMWEMLDKVKAEEIKRQGEKPK